MHNLNYLVLLAFVATGMVNSACNPGYFECRNGNCIHAMFVCDHQNDCGDLSDEIDIETGNLICPSCPVGMFECFCGVGRPKCISPTKVCDGVRDCGIFKEDEIDQDTGEGCPECPDGSVKCNNGQCVYRQWLCDGISDCVDQSDEQVDLCARYNQTVAEKKKPRKAEYCDFYP